VTIVFRADARQADELRRKVDGEPPDTQTAFYHADPFDIAAQLAGRRHTTPEEKKKYLDAVAKSGDSAPLELVDRDHPEREIVVPAGSRLRALRSK
jgi:hypothetical protein